VLGAREDTASRLGHSQVRCEKAEQALAVKTLEVRMPLRFTRLRDAICACLYDECIQCLAHAFSFSDVR
jgi:hypothetical protein